MPARSPGRPPASDVPSERRRHLACLAARRLLRLPVPAVARLSGVSERTVYGWSRRASDYPEASDPGVLAASLCGCAG